MRRDNAGQLIVMARGNPDPISYPLGVPRQRLTISDGRWNLPYQDFLSGRLAFNIDNRQAGPDARVSGRLNILTRGDAGKANAVLTICPGKLASMDSSEMPLQLTGEAKQKYFNLYAVLPAFRGSSADPQLTLHRRTATPRADG